MRDSTPSRTALATAFLRALHLSVDDPPPVLDDRLAADLLPGYQRRFLRRLGALATPWRGRYRQLGGAFTGLRAQVVVRARYAEDALRQARAEGVNRYVVLAAGLDTFAYRQPVPALPVVEIDHPATQRWKRDLLRERGVAIPRNVSYLPVDFERQALAERWPRQPGPDCVSWLGATYYLTQGAIADTLSALAGCTAPGSQLVLDYWCEAPPGEPDTLLLWSTRAAVALQDEPMRTFFAPAAIERLAGECGWRVRENCAPLAQDVRYLGARNDGLAVPSFAWLLHLER